MTHTPMPWRNELTTVFGPGLEWDGESDEQSNEIICSTIKKEDAAFVVRAVNAHKELLSWVKQVHDHEHQPMQDCPTCKLISRAEGK